MEEVEGAEPETCYVCLEECEDKSPCKCAHPLHSECLSALQANSNHCTICTWRFTNIDEDEDEDDDDDDDEDGVYFYFDLAAFLFAMFGFYVFSGYIGKCFVMPFYNVELLPFWTVEHFLCSIGFIVLSSIAIKIYKLII